MPATSVQGVFWSPLAPATTEGGQFTVESGGYQLSLEGRLFAPAPSRPSDAALTDLGRDAAQAVRNYRARLVHGTLADGRDVSLLDAHLSDDLPLSQPAQRLEGRRILWGAHVDPSTTHVLGVRWQMPLEINPWVSDDPCLASWGELRSWSEGGTAGLELHFARNMPLPMALDRVPSQTVSVLSVARGRRVDITHCQVLLADGSWRAYGIDNPPTRVSLQSVLACTSLDLNTLARWSDLSGQFAHFPYVASVTDMLLEPHTTAILTAFEGLHRRLYPKESRLPGTTNGDLKQAIKIAVDAAAGSLRDVSGADAAHSTSTPDTDVREVFRQALNHVHQLTYAQRLEALLEPVHDVAPELFAPSFPEWISRSKNLRNAESHALDKLDPFEDIPSSDYYVVRVSGQWALRLRLLLEVLEADVLRKALRSSSHYHFALARMFHEVTASA